MNRCGECSKAYFGGRPCCGECTIDNHPITVASGACEEFDQKTTVDKIDEIIEELGDPVEAAPPPADEFVIYNGKISNVEISDAVPVETVKKPRLTADDILDTIRGTKIEGFTEVIVPREYDTKEISLTATKKPRAKKATE